MNYHWTEYANPWVCARNIYRPDTADTQKPFQRLSDWRARIGALFIIYLSIPTTGWRDIFWGFTEKASLACLTGALVASAALMIFWLGSAHPLSPATKYYAQTSLKRAVLTLVITVALGVSVRVGLWAAIPFPLGWILGWWTIIFVFAMMWYSLRWVFGVSDANNLLGPVVSATTAVFAFTLEAIAIPSNLPRNIYVLINVTGLATVFLLALCEILYEFGRGWPAETISSGRRHPGYMEQYATADLHSRNIPWNTLAVASLPVTVIACWPVGIVLAVLALRQIRQTGERGTGLAWASLAFTAVFVLGMCVALVWKYGNIL